MDDLDDGPVFGVRTGPHGPGRLSPRSTLSLSDDDEAGDEAGGSDEEDEEEEEEEGPGPMSSASDSPPPSCSSRRSSSESPPGLKAQFPLKDAYGAKHTGSTTHVVTAEIIVETLEIREYDGSDYDGCVVIRPDAIEDADSERSRSRSRSRQRRDSNMASGMRDLNVFASSDDDDDLEETEHERKMREHREERRRARMSSGSITKRTVSERGSDSDSEDLANGHGLHSPHDPADAAHRRRLRRRLARNSVFFHEPAAPRIDEADEPDSSDEERDGLLARELSFFNYIFMEVDSP